MSEERCGSCGQETHRAIHQTDALYRRVLCSDGRYRQIQTHAFVPPVKKEGP